MESVWYIGILFTVYFGSTHCFPDVYKNLEQSGPSVLTPLINEGKLEEARLKARVASAPVKSYVGWLTVDESYNSNLFFWFFPSLTHYSKDPVVLWLQGGPGASSLFGAFMENGPLALTPDATTVPRNHSWAENHSVLYIDNPVGTGFSYTNEDGYARNQTIIGEHVYRALLQFFQLFPELQRNHFFVAGESYGGKYVPAVSYAIHKNNHKANQTINLKGLAIGNGLCDPQHQLKYSDYLYQIGLIDVNGKKAFHEVEQSILKYIKQEDWSAASKTFDYLLNGDLYNGSTVFHSETGFDNYFNYLFTKDASVEEDNLLKKFLSRSDVRKQYNLGNATFNDGLKVRINLDEDIMKSVAHWISELLDHYRVLFYNGQLDIIVAYPLTVNFLKHLKFKGADVYKKTARHQWHVGDDIAGYGKKAGKLTEILVRNAGHMVPADQPRWAFDLITKFTRNKHFW